MIAPSSTLSLTARVIRYETMHATLALLRDKYGGVEAYVTNFCGLGDDDISIIRSNLVISAKARM